MDEEWERFQNASYMRREADVNRADSTQGGFNQMARLTSCHLSRPDRHATPAVDRAGQVIAAARAKGA